MNPPPLPRLPQNSGLPTWAKVLIFVVVGSGVMIFVLGMLAAFLIPKYVKPRNPAQINACISNLRLIDSIKQQWALENRKKGTDTPTAEQLIFYRPFPICPVNGTYTIGTVDETPKCSIPGHQLSSD